MRARFLSRSVLRGRDAQARFFSWNPVTRAGFIDQSIIEVKRSPHMHSVCIIYHTLQPGTDAAYLPAPDPRVNRCALPGVGQECGFKVPGR